MNPALRMLIAGVLAAGGVWASEQTASRELKYAAIGAGAVAGAAVILFGDDQRKIVMRLGGTTWTRGEACRHFLITGDTGAGKTSGGMNPLLISLFDNDPTFGALVVDNKGVYWQTVMEMAEDHGRAKDIVMVRVRASADLGTEPPEHRYNIVGDSRQPFSARSRMLLDTSASQGGGGGGGASDFFEKRADSFIAAGMELLHELERPVNVRGVARLFQSDAAMESALDELAGRTPTDRRREIIEFFEEKWLRHKAPEQKEGERATISGILQYFLQPRIAEVFSSDEPDTFTFDDLDRGRILCLSMPQEYETERKYLTTMFKLAFYRHGLRRFDLPDKRTLGRLPLLVMVADEFQNFVTSSEKGLSDYNVADRLREAGVCLMVATQSSASLIPPHGGKEKAAVLMLNLRNRLIFRPADEECAKFSADFIGQRKKMKETRSSSPTGTSVSRQETEEHIWKPYQLRALKSFHAIVCHCTRGHRKTRLRPMDGHGRTH